MGEELSVMGGVVPLVKEGEGARASTWFVLAHGAGGSMDDPLLVGLSSRLAARGFGVVRFSFLYRALGKKLPDRMPILETTYREVLSALRKKHRKARWIIGGKSMGGRVASHLVAAGEDVAGLCLLSYPLLPPRKSKTDRITHLASISRPVVLVQGTRDPFGGPDAVAAHLHASATVIAVEGGDHDLCVPRSLRRTRDEVLDQVAEGIKGWLNPPAEDAKAFLNRAASHRKTR